MAFGLLASPGLGATADLFDRVPTFMLLRPRYGDGEVIGSVSGGCVEGAVVSAALEVLGGERPAGVITFGFSDDEAFSVGLTCGGTIHLFVEPLDW